MDSSAKVKSSKEDHVKDAGVMERRVGVDTGQIETAPEGGWEWCVMVACLLTHVIAIGLTRSIGVFYIQFIGYYGQSAEMTSLAASFSYILMLLLGPLASALCNRFTVRTVVALGATLCTVGMFLTAFSTDIYYIFFTFGLLLGVGFAFAYGPSLILLGQYFDKRRSFVASIATTGGALSSFVMPEMLEGLFSHYGFFGTFLILSAITSHLYIGAALSRPVESHHRQAVHKDRLTDSKNRETEKVQHEPKRYLSISTGTSTFGEAELVTNSGLTITSFKECEPEPEQSSQASKRRDTKDTLLIFSLLCDVSFVCLCTRMALVPLSFSTMVTYLPALATERGMDTLHGAYLLSVLSLCDASSRILFSIVLDLDRIRPYRLIIYNIVIFAFSVVTMAVPFMSTFSEFCIVAALYGVLCSLYIPQKSVVCVDVLGIEHLTSSLGLLLAFQGVGSLIAPVVGGLVKDALGSYDWAYYIASIGSFIAGVIMMAGNVWLYRRRQRALYDSF